MRKLDIPWMEVTIVSLGPNASFWLGLSPDKPSHQPGLGQVSKFFEISKAVAGSPGA